MRPQGFSRASSEACKQQSGNSSNLQECPSKALRPRSVQQRSMHRRLDGNQEEDSVNPAGQGHFSGISVLRQVIKNGLVGAWAHARRPAQNQPLSVEIKPSLFDCKRPPIINLYRRSNAEPLPFKPEPSPSNAGGLQQIFPARLSIGLARPAKLRPAPAEYLGRLTDGRASLLECRLWSSVDRRPLPDYRRSSFVGGASPKNCRPSSLVRQRRLFECRRSMFKVRAR